VKKLHHRRKLIAEVEEMENRLAVHVVSHNLNEIRIPGFEVTLINNEVIIVEIPLTDERQLNLLDDYFCLEYERR
jgi:hypothetical protein